MPEDESTAFVMLLLALSESLVFRDSSEPFFTPYQQEALSSPADVRAAVVDLRSPDPHPRPVWFPSLILLVKFGPESKSRKASVSGQSDVYLQNAVLVPEVYGWYWL